MTPEQTNAFLLATQKLIEAAADGKLTAPELRSGMLFLWLGRGDANGYVNLPHQEAWAVCGTTANSTMRAHLLHLRDAGIVSEYSTNGTVRMKFSTFPGKELIVHRRDNSLTESSNSLTESSNSLTESAQVDKNDTTRASSARFCSLSQLVRALDARPSRNFDDYPQETGSIVVSKTYLSISPDKSSNLLTASAQIDPLEEAMTVSLMLAVGGFWPKTVKEFAKKYPFELVRRAIGYWDDNRKENGGTLSDKPGSVVAWLNDGEEMPPLSETFKRSDLYLRHRTKAEVEADRRIEEEQAQWAAIEQAIDVTAEAAIIDEPAKIETDIDAADIWQQTLQLVALNLPPSTKVFFENTTAAVRDGEFVIFGKATQVAMLKDRYKMAIKRSLGRVLGQEIQDLTFEVRA